MATTEEIIIKVKGDISELEKDLANLKAQMASIQNTPIAPVVTPTVNTTNVTSTFTSLKDTIKGKFDEITGGIASQLKSIGSGAVSAFNTMRNAGVSSFRAIGGAIASSGIGLLPIALGLIAANWEKITDSILGTTNAMKALDEATLESSKELEKAFEKVNKVSIAFEEAKKGVLSKEKALKIYNETLGKSLGDAQSLEEAEKIYRNNTEAFIKATQARAVAKALEKKAAELQTEALIDTELSMFDKLLTATSVYGFIRSNSETEIKKRRKAQKEKEAQDILNIATTKNNEAIYWENQYSKELGEVEEKTGKKTINNSKKIKDQRIKDIKDVVDYSKSVYTSTEDQVSDPKKYQEITDIIKKAEDDKADSLLSSYDRDLKAIEENYGAKILFAEEYGLSTAAIEQEMFDKIDELNKKKAKQDEENTAQILKNQNSVITGTENQTSTIEDLIAKQKQAVNELLDFAQNGILLSIGLNPQDVQRVRTSLEELKKTLDNSESTPAERAAKAAEAAGAAYQTVSNSIFAADTQRRQEELAALQGQQEEELRLAGDNEQKKELIKQKYLLKEKEIKRKQAEADKRKAIFDATVNTAVAVITGFVRGGPILAAIAAVLGAAQIALISATPIPKFAKGGAVPSSDIQGMINGRPHASGGVLIEAEGNEFITRKSQAMKGENLGLLEAINMSDSERDAYISRHYVMPALQAKESQAANNYRHSVIEAENNLIARVSSHTLKSIHKEQRNTTEAIKRLDKKDFKW